MTMIRKHKEHTNYSSAFAIGEHAELRFDLKPAFFRVEAVSFTVNGLCYDLAIAIDVGTVAEPKIEYHSARPIKGVDGRLLKEIPDPKVEDPNFGTFPTIDQAQYQVGDIVALDLSEEGYPGELDAIPVLVWGVRYNEGKICYDVSIDAKEYDGTPAQNNVYERYLKHSLDNIDSVFIQPVGGWTMEEAIVIHTKPEPQHVEIRAVIQGKDLS